MIMVALRQFALFDQTWLMLVLSAVGVIALHSLFRTVYKMPTTSKALAWSLISLPYDCLVALLPSKTKKGKKIRFKRPK